jgi:hypothetical protein
MDKGCCPIRTIPDKDGLLGVCSIHPRRRSHFVLFERSLNIIGMQESSRRSRSVQIVIAKHSPERILEGELPIEAPEKNHGKDNDAAQQANLSGPVCLPGIAERPPFSHVSRAT